MQTTRSSALRLLAIFLFLVTTTVWFAGGAHRGWTRTTITEMRYDEFTGIEYPVQRDAFVPGVDLLGAGFLAAAVIGSASLIGSRRRRGNAVDSARPAEGEA